MAIEKQRLWLDFPADLVTKPIVYELVKRFDVVPNIRQASIASDSGVMSLEVEGERKTIQQAIAWLEEIGVKVDPVEINVIEG